MSHTLHARLVAYRPFGARIGVLAEPVSFSASMLHNDGGAISIEYSMLSGDAQAFDRELTDGLEVAVEVSDGTGYHEPDNARYVITGRSGKTDDRTRTVTYSGQSISWLLSKAENNDSSHLLTDGDNKGKRPFYSSNPGTILKTLLDENRQRGGVATGLTLGFDTAKDASGAAWARKYTLYYSLGTDLQTILSSLVNGGGCDWRTSGRTLKLWNADSVALSRDLSKQVVLQLARDIGEAPYEESISDLASTILVEGDNNLLFRMDNPAAPTPWGKWESYSSQGGVSDKDTAQAFMASTLADAARVRGQYTRDLVISDVDSLPLVDYHAGDWITAPTVSHGEKVRVQEIDLSMRQGEGLSASIALNDIKYDASVRQAKKIKGITGGAALAGSESGTTASSDRDHRVPRAPQGLVVQTDAYIGSDGFAHGLATAMWSAVTEATNDTAIEISNYAIEWRKHVDGAPWHSAGTTDKTQLGFGGLDCGTQIEVRVRAVPTYSDKLGEWSSIFVVTVENDVTPCSVPSKPVLSSELGVVTIHWDGKTDAGASMEPDFDHVEVGRGTTANDLTPIASTQSGQGDYLDTTRDPGTTWAYALRSVDHAGNRSAWSALTSITVASTVSHEEIVRIDSTLTQARKDIQSNTQTIATANSTLTQARKDIQANSDSIKQTKSDLDAANSTLTQAQKDIQANATELATAKSDLAATQSTLTQARKDIQANQTVITSTEATLTKTNADLTQARNDIAAAQQAASDAQNAAAKAQNNADTLSVQVTQAKDTATKAQATADGKNMIYRGPTEPSHDGLRPGDLWWRTQAYFTRWAGEPDASESILADFYTEWAGEPDASESILVPLIDRVIDVRMWDGTRFDAYNVVARNVVATGSISTDLLAANAITTDKLAASAVTTDKLAAGSVQTDKLAAGSVTTDRISALAVTVDKIAANAVTADKIAANAVNAGSIAAGAVTADKIAANSVTTDKLAANSVTTAKLVAGAVNADRIAANAVTTAKIAAGAVTASQLAANAVTADKVKAMSIGTGQLAANAVTADKLSANAVVAGKLAVDSVNAGNIVSGAVTADKLAANAVTTDKLAANAVTADKILAGTITSDKVAAGQFKGYIFTGAVFQSSESSDTGIKINATALQMWDSQHHRTVYLDGEGKNNVLTGSFRTAVTGNRVEINNSATSTIIGSNTSISGQSIVFAADDLASSPQILGSFSHSDLGYAPQITLLSGYKADHDPAAVFYLQSWPRTKGTTGSGITSRALITANTDYKESDYKKKSYATLDLQGIGGSGAYASLETYAYAGNEAVTWVTASRNDGVTNVGICADAFTRSLYLGGKIGGIAGQKTFQVANWKYVSGVRPHETAGVVTVAMNPAKYGVYHAVANADCAWGSMFVHVAGSGNASQFQVIGYNAGDGDPTGDVWVDAIAWLT